MLHACSRESDDDSRSARQSATAHTTLQFPTPLTGSILSPPKDDQPNQCLVSYAPLTIFPYEDNLRDLEERLSVKMACRFGGTAVQMPSVTSRFLFHLTPFLVQII